MKAQTWMAGSFKRCDVVEGSSACQESFLELLKELCGPESPLITVVLICRESSLVTAILGHGMIDSPDYLERNTVASSMKRTRSINKRLKWTENNPEKKHFLHTLCLMQRTRFLTTVWSTPVKLLDGHSNQLLNTDAQTWIKELEEHGLIRRKSGGFIWMHTTARGRLRDILTRRIRLRDELPEDISSVFSNWPSLKKRVRHSL